MDAQDRLRFEVPAEHLGYIIGKKGATIQRLQQDFGCRIRVVDDKYVILDNNTGQRDLAEVQAYIKKMWRSHALPKPTPHVTSSHQLLPTSRELGVTVLYVDILSYANRFFDSSEFSFTHAERKIARFCEAAALSGVKLVCFFPALRIDDALDRVERNMARSIRDGTRLVPMHMQDALEEALRKHGAEVRFSTHANNDTTMAAYAFQDGGVPVLSKKRSFLRFVAKPGDGDGKCHVYTDFGIDGKSGGGLRLEKQQAGKDKPLAVEPDFVVPQYATDSATAQAEELRQTKLYLGGAPSPLVRELKRSPYADLVPIRQLYYAKLFGGCDSVVKQVKETYPVWNDLVCDVEYSTAWVKVEEVEPEWEELVANSPEQAFKRLFPNLTEKPPGGGVTWADWRKHQHVCKSMFVNLCVLINKLEDNGGGEVPASATPFLDWMKQVEADEKWGIRGNV